MVIMYDKWTEEQQTRAGISAWDCGVFNIGSHESIDAFTQGQDFSSDIFARAQYFAENGYWTNKEISLKNDSLGFLVFKRFLVYELRL